MVGCGWVVGLVGTVFTHTYNAATTLANAGLCKGARLLLKEATINTIVYGDCGCHQQPPVITPTVGIGGGKRRV